MFCRVFVVIQCDVASQNKRLSVYQDLLDEYRDQIDTGLPANYDSHNLRHFGGRRGIVFARSLTMETIGCGPGKRNHLKFD